VTGTTRSERGSVHEPAMASTKPPSSLRPRQRMVRALEASGAIRDARVRLSFLAEPRERYVPEITQRDGLEAVYRPEAALVTVRDSNGATLSSASAPGVMAPMLEALDLSPGLRVLEIGTGTGYNAALLSRLVGDAGKVTSVEVHSGIARQARRHLAEGGHRVRVVVGDGRTGWPSAAPFDRIIATASSSYVPLAWRDQVTDGGLVVLPLGFGAGFETQAIVSLRRDGDVFRSTVVFPGGFIPLRATGDTHSPIAAPPSLTASTTSGAKGSTLARLTGPPLGRLSEAHRRRLLSNVLSPARSLKTFAASHTPGLLLFLSLHPAAQTVRCSFGSRFGVGVVGARGNSFAALTCTVGKPGRVEAWGDAAAEGTLGALIDEWRRAGKPALGNLAVTIDYESAELPARPSWLRLRTPEGAVSLNWEWHTGKR